MQSNRISNCSLPAELWTQILKQPVLSLGDLGRFGMTCSGAQKLVRSSSVDRVARKCLFSTPKVSERWLDICQRASHLVSPVSSLQPLAPRWDSYNSLLIVKGARAVVVGEGTLQVYNLTDRKLIHSKQYKDPRSITEIKIVDKSLYVRVCKYLASRFEIFDLSQAGPARDHGAVSWHRPISNADMRSAISESGYFATLKGQDLELFQCSRGTALRQIAVNQSLKPVRVYASDQIVLLDCRRRTTKERFLKAYSIPDLKPLFLFAKPDPWGQVHLTQGVLALHMGWPDSIQCLDALTGKKQFSRNARLASDLRHHFFSANASLIINREETVDLIVGNQFRGTLPAPDTILVRAAGDIGVTVSRVGPIIRLWRLSDQKLVKTIQPKYHPHSIAMCDGQLVIIGTAGRGVFFLAMPQTPDEEQKRQLRAHRT